MDISIRIKFLGGLASGKNLTGSAIHLIIRTKKTSLQLLVDSGLIQEGSYEQSLKNNLEILKYITAKNLDYAVITHAHTDHCGTLPLLTKNGFGGKGGGGRIICTEATGDLLSTMLQDSAHIQEVESRKLNAKKRHGKRQKGSTEPAVLYSANDVVKTCQLIKNGGYGYDDRFIRLSHEVSVRFYPSGHILGGAIVVLRITGRKTMYLGFTGDLGRLDGTILPAPDIIQEPLDALITEATYGGEDHPASQPEITELISLVKKAAAEKKKIIIPSFALQRTQEVVYLLSKLMSSGQIPALPIFLDSPLAAKITKIFSQKWHSDLFRGQEALDFNPFDPGSNRNLYFVDNKEASMALIQKPGPHIVIAGSGMCDAGRVIWHLHGGLSSEKTMVFLVGFMSKNSLGWQLQNGATKVRINKTDIPIRAKVVSFKRFSSHAGGDELVDYTRAVMSEASHESKIFLVHGELDSALKLKSNLLASLPVNGWDKNIIIPQLREEVLLSS